MRGRTTMKTAIVDAQSDLYRAVAAADEVLNRKELVALPTETVYGLAGDALEPEAVARIFEAKERPFFDPLIVHVESKEWLPKITPPPGRAKAILEKVGGRFW